MKKITLTKKRNFIIITLILSIVFIPIIQNYEINKSYADAVALGLAINLVSKIGLAGITGYVVGNSLEDSIISDFNKESQKFKENLWGIASINAKYFYYKLANGIDSIDLDIFDSISDSEKNDIKDDVKENLSNGYISKDHLIKNDFLLLASSSIYNSTIDFLSDDYDYTTILNDYYETRMVSLDVQYLSSIKKVPHGDDDLTLWSLGGNVNFIEKYIGNGLYTYSDTRKYEYFKLNLDGYTLHTRVYFDSVLKQDEFLTPSNISIDFTDSSGNSIKTILNSDLSIVLNELDSVFLEYFGYGNFSNDFYDKGYTELYQTIDTYYPKYNKLGNISSTVDFSNVPLANINNSDITSYINDYKNTLNTNSNSLDYSTYLTGEIAMGGTYENYLGESVEVPPVTLTPTNLEDGTTVLENTTPEVPTSPDSSVDTLGFLDSITSILSSIWGVIKAIPDFFTSVLEHLGNFWGVLKDIPSHFSDVLGFLGDIVGYLNPLSDSFFLKLAFVPSSLYFQNYWNDIYSTFNNKIPLFGDIKQLFDNVINISYSEEIPQFDFSIPKYGVDNASLIDFSFFTKHKFIIINFIRFSSWFIFLKKLFKKLPKVVY